MTEAARRLLIVMLTEPKALVDLPFYLEKNFSVLPPEIACGVSNGQSLAFDLLRTVRLAAFHWRRSSSFSTKAW